MYQQQLGVGEGVGGELWDGSESMDGVLSSVITCTMTLNKSISSPNPTNELLYSRVK